VAGRVDVASFSGCSIDKVGNGYTLTATDSNNGINSAATQLDVIPGPGASLVFTVSPSDSKGGTAFATQPVVAIEDSAGNVVTTATNNVQLSITTNTGTAGATLTCTTNPLAPTSGYASFSGCTINLAGTQYKLTASSTTLTTATRSPFTVS